MHNEPIDFDDMFPTFDPASFDDHYPSKDDFPSPFWDIAMRRVYDHELYQMARDSDYAPDMRTLARRAWEAIEQNAVDAFVCDLAGQLLDRALDQDNEFTLEPLVVSVYLSVILWTAFREPGGARWLQHVLHAAIGIVDLEGLGLSVEQAFVAGWAAGCVDGEFGGRHALSGEVAPSE